MDEGNTLNSSPPPPVGDMDTEKLMGWHWRDYQLKLNTAIFLSRGKNSLMRAHYGDDSEISRWSCNHEKCQQLQSFDYLIGEKTVQRFS